MVVAMAVQDFSVNGAEITIARLYANRPTGLGIDSFAFRCRKL